MLASPAAAAPPWSEPAGIPGAPDAFPLAGMTASGNGLAVWPGPVVDPRSTQSEVAALGPQGTTFGQARPLGALAVGAIATFAQDRVLVAGHTRRDGKDSAAYAFGSGDGTFSPVRSFRLSGTSSRVQALATAPTGAAAMTVITCETARCATKALFVVLRRPGAQFAKTMRLVRGERIQDSAVAINERGDALVTWERARYVYTRLRTAGGRLGPLQRIGRGVQASLSAELGPAREAIVAWGHQRVSSGTAHSSFFANVAYRAGSYRTGFRTPRQLGEVPVRGAGRYVARPGVATALEGGRGTVAYVTSFGGRYLVQTRDVVAGRLQPPVTVSPGGTDAILADLAAAPGGRQLVLTITGRRGNDASGPVELWGTPRGGAPERIGGGDFIDTAAAGLSSTGRAFAVWRSVGAPVTASVRPGS